MFKLSTAWLFVAHSKVQLKFPTTVLNDRQKGVKEEREVGEAKPKDKIATAGHALASTTIH